MIITEKRGIDALLLIQQNPDGGCPPPGSLPGPIQARLVSLLILGALKAHQETSNLPVYGSLGPTGLGEGTQRALMLPHHLHFGFPCAASPPPHPWEPFSLRVKLIGLGGLGHREALLAGAESSMH